MPFIDLGTDVLLHILTLVDVYTVLALSRVNRLLHEIGSTKQVWLKIVGDMASRRLIDPLLFDIDTLSKDALFEEVRRVVRGPRTWSQESPIPPKVSRQIDFGLEDSYFAEPLAGGRYILCLPISSNAINVKCLEAGTGRCAWTWSRPGCWVDFAVFDFHTGSQAVVVLSVYGPTHETQLVFLEVDLNTGESPELVHLPSGFPAFYPGSPHLRGNFFLCHVRTQHGQFLLLINWRTEEFIAFETISAEPSIFDSFALLPGGIALTHPSSGGSAHPRDVHVYSITDLAHLWRPWLQFDFSSSVDTRQCPSIHLPIPHTDTCDAPYQHIISLSAAVSPVRDDTHEITVQLTEFCPAPRPRRFASLLRRFGIRSARPIGTTNVTVSRYLVTVPTRDACSTLTLKSIFRDSKVPTSFSGAGYALYVPNVVRRLDEKDGANLRRLELPFSPGCFAQLTHAGAVFVRQGTRGAILYYE